MNLIRHCFGVASQIPSRSVSFDSSNPLVGTSPCFYFYYSCISVEICTQGFFFVRRAFAGPRTTTQEHTQSMCM